MPIAPVGRLKKKEIVWLSSHKCKHGHCLNGDTLVTMSDFSHKKISDIKEGDSVLGFAKGKGCDSKIMPSLVQKTTVHNAKQQLIFDQFTLTPPHLVWVYSKRGPKMQGRYTPAAFLENKSTPKLPIFHRTDGWKFGYLLGFFASDGNYNTRSIVFNNTNKYLADTIVRYLTDLKIKSHLYTDSTREFKPMHRISVYEQEFRLNFADALDAITKCKINRFSDDELRGFVAGFYDGDGSQNNVVIAFYNTNLEYLNTLITIIKKFGFDAKEPSINREPHVRKIGNRIATFKEPVYVFSVPDRGKFWCTFLPLKQTEKYPFYLNKQVFDYTTFEDPIVKDFRLFPIADPSVFDIQTTTGNFFANGVPVHNSYLEHYSCFLTEVAAKHKWEPGSNIPIPNRIGFLDVETTGFQSDFGFMLTYCIKDSLTGDILHDFITKKDMEKDLDKRILSNLIKDMKVFDRIVGYYSSKFDIPFARSRALYWDLAFPKYSELLHSDLYYTVRNKLKLSRSRQQTAFNFLIEEPIKVHKASSYGRGVWTKAATGDPKAIQYILTHNMEDVEMLSRLWYKLEKFSRRNDTSI